MEKKWWKERVVYQIYTRSFRDSNGDGIGDLRGIIEKLGYLTWLGIGAVWLNPIYDTPNDDMGYDIRDYEMINSDFGDTVDFEMLLEELHKRDIKLIMDLAINHSSDEHVWFVESRKSKDNPYRDFYIWRDGKHGGEPNNWASFFTPSAWHYDEATEQWYLHLFSEKQPDLNWENPGLRERIYAMINRWLDKGVDGFRMDMINVISKEEDLHDGEGKPNEEGYVFASEHFANQPKLHGLLQEMRETCFKGSEVLFLGETPFVTPKLGRQLTDPSNKELDMIFQFELMDIDSGPSGKWEIVPFNISRFKHIIDAWQTGIGDGWNSLFLGNHDQPRVVSRFGCCDSEELRVRSAKMLATAMYLLKGTPFIFQGEELGMTNVPFRDISEIRDLESINFFHIAGKHGKATDGWNSILKKGRDNARTPMQWDNSKNAGFSSGDSWLMVNPNYKMINVDAAMQDYDSILYYYKSLLEIRKRSQTMIYGEYLQVMREHHQVFAYMRSLNDENILVLCNMTGEPAQFEIPHGFENYVTLITNIRSEGKGEFLLPYEARVIKV